MNIARRFALIAFLLLPAALSAEEATVYRWVDAGGQVHFSQIPPESGKYDLIQGRRPSAPAPGAESGTQTAATTDGGAEQRSRGAPQGGSRGQAEGAHREGGSRAEMREGARARHFPRRTHRPPAGHRRRGRQLHADAGRRIPETPGRSEERRGHELPLIRWMSMTAG
jgi:hypothetical protein